MRRILRIGQMKKEKYSSHIILYARKISDPVHTPKKKVAFASIENSRTERIFLLAKAKIINEKIKEILSRKIII